MLEAGNVLILDEPVNHLDLESITALNNALKNFKGVLLISSHDEELLDTVVTRVIKINKTKVYDRETGYSDFLENN